MNVHKKIRRAILESKSVRISYKDSEGNDSTRIIVPMYLFIWRKHYYASGYCFYENDIRHFKISRINSCSFEGSSSMPVDSVETAVLSHIFTKQSIIIDTYPSELHDQIEQLGYELTRDQQNFYPKKIHMNKMTKPGWCRSSLEESIFSELSRNPEVIEFESEPVKIKYWFEGKERQYIPDIRILYGNGTIEIVEVKVSGDISHPINQAKFETANNYCNENGYKFSIYSNPW